MVPERAAHDEDMSLHRLWLNHNAGPHGLEQFIVRDQAPGVFDQIGKDCKRFWRQQDTRLMPCIAAPPQTLVQGIESECSEQLHRRPGDAMDVFT